jgi:hypothetical protein
MTWKISSGDYRSGYDWRMDWSIQGLPLQPGINQIAITVEDIKGLTASKVLKVTRK